MVASDRVSAFDVIMAEPIRNKGRVLTAMTAFWCGEMSDVVPGTLLATDPEEIEAALPGLDLPAGMGRTGRAGAAGRNAPDRVHRAGLPGRPGPRGVREVGHRARHGHARRPAAGRPPGRAHLHPLDQGRRRARHQHRLRPGGRPGRGGSGGGGPGHLPRALRPCRGAGGRRRVHPGRHQVRARLCRRRAQPVRRGVHAGLLAAVAGRPGGPRPDAAGLRQAAPAGLVGRAALGPHATTAASPDQRDHRPLRALRGRVRASHRTGAGRLVRCELHEVPGARRGAVAVRYRRPRGCHHRAGAALRWASTGSSMCGPGVPSASRWTRSTRAAARTVATELADRLLANPVIEESRLELVALGG